MCALGEIPTYLPPPPPPLMTLCKMADEFEVTEDVALDTLRENYDVLIDSLSLAEVTRLVAGLFARHCLTEYERADILEGARTGFEKGQRLVDCLLRRGPGGFIAFCNLLEAQGATRSLSAALKEAASRPVGSTRRVRDNWNAGSEGGHQLELGPSADQQPSQRDLNRVGVTAEWRQLGVELGVPVTTLDEVEYDHRQEGIREVRSKMFEAWLKESPSVTWRALIRALENIGLVDKAAALVAEHGLQQ